jgi:hypothetical protein
MERDIGRSIAPWSSASRAVDATSTSASRLRSQRVSPRRSPKADYFNRAIRGRFDCHPLRDQEPVRRAVND